MVLKYMKNFVFLKIKKKNKKIDKYWKDLEKRYNNEENLRKKYGNLTDKVYKLNYNDRPHELYSYCPNDRYKYSNRKNKECKQVLKKPINCCDSGENTDPKIDIHPMYRKKLYKSYSNEIL